MQRRELGPELPLEHLQLGLDVVELFGRGRTVGQQALDPAPLDLLFGDLLAQGSHLAGDVGPPGAHGGLLPPELQALQGELHGVDDTQLLSRLDPVALHDIECQNAPRRLGRYDHLRGLERSRGIVVPFAAAGAEQRRSKAANHNSSHRFIVCFSS